MRGQHYATSPEQSLRLIRAGIDVKSADLVTEPFLVGDYSDPHLLPDVYEYFPEDVTYDIAIPSWSVSGLMNMLLCETYGTVEINATRSGVRVDLHWITLYADMESVDDIKAPTILEALVELTEVYLSKYKKGGKP